MPAGRPPVPLRVRFDAKWQLDPETGCWLWIGACDRNGYGVVRVGEGTDLAHRVAWQLYRGPIPDDECVLHSCDTPACVKPDDLFLGTQAVNLADMRAKGREARGERNGATKLDEATALTILKLRTSGRTQANVAAEFGISRREVGHIWTGECWSHLATVAA